MLTLPEDLLVLATLTLAFAAMVAGFRKAIGEAPTRA